MLGRPCGREEFQLVFLREVRWIEEGRRIFLRVAKGMWHGDMAGAKARRKRSERFTWNGVEEFKRRAVLGNNGW